MNSSRKVMLKPVGKKKVVLIVNEKAYRADRVYADTCIEMGREKYKGKYAIIALEKDNMVMLRKDEYGSKEDMQTAIDVYRKDGCKVTYTALKEA